MPELLLFFAILFVVVTLVAVGVAVWILLAGDREQDFTDEDVRFTTSFEEED